MVSRMQTASIWVSMIVLDCCNGLGPFSANLGIGPVYAPTGRAWPAPLPTHSLFDFGRMALNPAIDRGAIRPDSALCRHLLEDAAADPVSAMPSHGPKHDLSAKMPSLEITRDLFPPTLPRGRCPINLLFATEPLGFTHIWGKSRRGHWVVRQVTAKDRLARAATAVYDWCKRNLHRPLSEQREHLARVIRGTSTTTV